MGFRYCIDDYRFGFSLGGRSVVSLLAWPNEWVILVGSFLATTGAGLQSLISAPRLLYAISKDELVPALNRFSTLSPSGEPTRALFATLGNNVATMLFSVTLCSLLFSKVFL